MNLRNLKIYFIFLTAVFGFLFFGSNALAINCKDITDTQSADFSCQITYTDTGGSGLAECKYRLVGTGYDSGWLLTTGIQPCSGSSATRDAWIDIPDPPGSSTYTIQWGAKDAADNWSEGNVKTFNVAACIPPSGNWEIKRYCILDTSGSDLVIKDKVGATETEVKRYTGTYTLTLSSDIYIKNGGTLDMKGNSNISFSGSPRYIYVDPGGNLYQSNTAGINK